MKYAKHGNDSRYGRNSRHVDSRQKRTSRFKQKTYAGYRPAKNRHSMPDRITAVRDHDTKIVWLGSGSEKGFEFEDTCYEIFERCGFKSKKFGGVHDEGRDILVWNSFGKIVVECKHHASRIGRPEVQKLHSAMDTEGAVGAVLVSTGGFTSYARDHTKTISRSRPEDTIANLRSKKILLVDLDGLRKIASSVGIDLRNGEDPDTGYVKTSHLEEMFAHLKSHPDKPRDLVTCRKTGKYDDMCWIVEIEIDQVFTNSSRRQVHHMQKRERFACRSDGDVLDGDEAKKVLSGGDGQGKAGKNPSKGSIIKYVQKKYKKRVRYRGGNGHTYSMTCIPSTSNVICHFKSIRVERTSVTVKIKRREYKWSIPWWDRKVTCRRCGEPSTILNPLLICNDCGTISHSKRCGGQCNKCRRTMCAECAIPQKKMLITKLLCTTCFKSNRQ